MGWGAWVTDFVPCSESNICMDSLNVLTGPLRYHGSPNLNNPYLEEDAAEIKLGGQLCPQQFSVPLKY